METIGPYKYSEGHSAHRLGADSLYLADFAIPLINSSGEPSVIDLGTGAGVLPILLTAKTNVKKILGIEIDPELAEDAQENVERNDLSTRVKVECSDWRELYDDYGEGSFPLVISNPPYVKAGSGRVSPDIRRRRARSEISGTLRDLIEVCAYLAGAGGRLVFVFPMERQGEMITELSLVSFKPQRLRLVYPSGDAGQVARVFLIEAAMASNITDGKVVIEPPIYDDAFGSGIGHG